MNRNLQTFLSGIALCTTIVATTSCQCNRANKDNLTDGLDSIGMNQAGVDDINKSKTIFYTIPSPIEIAVLVKNAGVAYDEDVLNAIDNSSKYQTNMKMALNLGVYSADMSFASLFEQAQTTVKYMNTMKGLAERLGVIQIIDDKMVDKFEDKNSSREDILNIISEVYMNANAFLTENNRKSIAAMVLAGGWVEGLHIAMKLTDADSDNNEKLIERIVFQKLSLETLICIIDDNLKANSEDADMLYLKSKMTDLKTIFDEISVNNSGPVKATTDAQNHITTLTSTNTAHISQDIYNLLCEKVTEIRNEFVN